MFVCVRWYDTIMPWRRDIVAFACMQTRLWSFLAPFVKDDRIMWKFLLACVIVIKSCFREGCLWLLFVCACVFETSPDPHPFLRNMDMGPYDTEMMTYNSWNAGHDTVGDMAIIIYYIILGIFYLFQIVVRFSKNWTKYHNLKKKKTS